MTQPQLATMTITNVGRKTGIVGQGARQGQPWVLYTIETNAGFNVTTFDQTLGTLAEGLVGSTVPMRWEETEKPRRDGEGMFTDRKLTAIGDGAIDHAPAQTEAGAGQPPATPRPPITPVEMYESDTKHRTITREWAYGQAIGIVGKPTEGADTSDYWTRVDYFAETLIEKVIEKTIQEETPSGEGTAESSGAAATDEIPF